MWREEENDVGSRVRLYQPILYGKKPSQEERNSSFIGGSVQNHPLCPICGRRLFLLVQLSVPKARTRVHQGGEASSSLYCILQVFACNTASCCRNLFSTEKLCYGGNGVVICRSLACEVQPYVTSQSIDNPTEQKTDGDLPAGSEDDNEWLVDSEDPSVDLVSLEAKLASLETQEAEPKGRIPSGRKEKLPTIDEAGSFPCYSLHAVLEPAARFVREMLDEDDVGMASVDDAKIREMLARYMAEEEDEGILAALRGSLNSGSAEQDERLSDQDRALLAFSDRIKRSPRQVLRYALGGIPMWSIPLSSQQRHSNLCGIEEDIPRCDCGSERIFEVQILPSLLSVLDVDKFAQSLPEGGDLVTVFDQGGMNWGNIAVYSCAQCCDSGSEYVVVQAPVDSEAIPVRESQYAYQEDVVIAEDATFDDQDEDDF